MRIHTEKEAARAAALAINKQLEESREEGTPLLLMFAGGSALDTLRYLEEKHAREQVTITVVDERYSTDPHVNNFAQLSRSNFFRNAVRSGAHTIDTRVQGKEDIKHLAERFDAALKSWRREHPEGVVVAIMGIGTNGHIAGIMPHEETGQFLGRFEDRDKWVVAYRALPSQTQHIDRVTTTLSFIRFQIAHAIVYAIGQEKREALAKARSEFGMLSEVPARILQYMDNVDIYTDIEVT